MSFTYKLYTGDPEALADVATIEGETFESQGTDIGTLSTTSTFSPGDNISGNILAIHDQTGEKAVYDVISVLLLDPSVESIDTFVDGVQATSFEGDAEDTFQISWEIDVKDSENDDVVIASSDESVVVLSNIDYVNRTATATLQAVEAGGTTTADLIITADLDGTVVTISASVSELATVSGSQSNSLTFDVV